MNQTTPQETGPESILDVLLQFEARIDGLDQLAQFDDLLLHIAKSGLEDVERVMADIIKLPNHPKLAQIRTKIALLENIQSHDDLAASYVAMYNSLIVLLVSALSATLEDLMVAAINATGTVPKEAQKDLKVPFEVAARNDMSLGRLVIVADRSISFQDMQSTVRTLEKFCGVTMSRSTAMETILVAQAARHAIVHVAARRDKGFDRQVQGIASNPLLLTQNGKSTLSFDERSYTLTREAMRTFITELVGQLTGQ